MPQTDLFTDGLKADTIVGGKYRLASKISEGGGGVVWEAVDPDGESVALKFLKWSPLKSRTVAAERFKNEFAILKSLAHPHISQIYDFGIDPDSDLYFFTSELLRQGDLKTIVGDPIPELETLLLEALRALEYLRGHKLLHLDIKPQNLLLRLQDGKRSLALIDFGLATFRPPDRPGGTPNYIPPELVAMRHREEYAFEHYPKPDHRSDLYSLGVTFYYCLTGVQPFAVKAADGKRIDAAATLRRHCEFTPPPPSTYRPEIPAYLDRIIMKLMARHPDDRYPSALIAAQALQYSSPHQHAPESRQTLLAYLPKEGKLIGRHDERRAIERGLNAIAEGSPQAMPIFCIAGGRGCGRSRLLEAIKPVAQQLELSVSLLRNGDADDVATLESILEERTKNARPHVIIVDDLDTILDEENSGSGEMLAAIHALIRRLRLQHRLSHAPGARILFLFGLNTDRVALGEALTSLDLDEAICRTVPLKNFTLTEVSEYLTALLGETPDPSVAHQLLACSDGSPLFITEQLEAMIAKGQLFSLAGRPDARTLKTIGIDFSHAPPSQTLAESVHKRIALLPTEAQHLALMLACWGRPVGAEELRATARSATTSHELLLLVSAGLVRRDERDGRFAFANALTSRIIHDGADETERAQCHDAIAHHLDNQRSKKRIELDRHIGYGTPSSQQPAALEHLADHALRHHDPLEAIIHLKKLLEITPLNEPHRRADVLIKLGRAYERANRPEEAQAAFRRLHHLKGPGNLALQFRIRAAEQLGLAAMRRRHLRQARRSFAEALSLLEDVPGALVWRLQIENSIAGCDLREGHIEAALERFERTAKVSEMKLPENEQRRITNNERGETLLRAGEIQRALAILNEELALAEMAGDAERTANRHYLIGNALRRDSQQRFEEALQHYRQGLAIARRHHLIRLQVRLHNGMGNLSLKLDRPDMALDHYREGLALAQQIEGETTSVELMIGMGLAAQQMAEPDDTIEYFEAALDFSNTPQGATAGLIRRYRPTIFVSLADAYYQKHELERSEDYIRQGLALDHEEHFSPDLRYSLYGTFVEIQLDRGAYDEAKKYLPTLEVIAKTFPPAEKHLAKIRQALA